MSFSFLYKFNFVLFHPPINIPKFTHTTFVSGHKRQVNVYYYKVYFLFSGFVTFETLEQILINVNMIFNEYPFSLFMVVTLARKTKRLENLKINC